MSLLRVVATSSGHRLSGDGADVEVVNAFLGHLVVRNFSPATVRAYAYDLLIFMRFLSDRGMRLAEVSSTDVFDWLDWQSRPKGRGERVVRISAARGAAPATMNRRVAAVRGLFGYAITAGHRDDNPVPAGRRSTGLRARRRGMLGHVKPRRQPTEGGRLVQTPRRLPENLTVEEVAAFLADLDIHRDRAMALAMLQGGLRAGEVRRLLLADVDMGLRRLRVIGKGNRERIVPVDRTFFTELAAYVHHERPAGLTTAECFVVLRGPTRGQPMTEAGMRKIFRVHRASSGAQRVRPHRLRHTYGTELAAAGIDLLVLQELMGHASPETTAGYVHLAPNTLAAEFARARAEAHR